MSILEIRHEFFNRNTELAEQLFQSFCNHVHLNQWQFARLALELLKDQSSRLKINLTDLLVDIIQNPSAYCSRSKSVPSPFHLALLLLDECESKNYLPEQIIKSLRPGATYRYLLCVGDIQPSSQVVQEFEKLRTAENAIPSHLLTETMADFLVDLWLNEVPRVHALVSKYLLSPEVDVELWLLKIHRRALDQALHQLKTLQSEEKKSLVVDLLLSLQIYSCEKKQFRSIMTDTLKSIVVYASENHLNGPLLNLKLLYRSVLINPALAEFVAHLESDHRRSLAANESIIIHFQKKNSSGRESFFWREFYLYLIENKTDLISCVLDDTLQMIRHRNFSRLDEFLKIEQLSSLHLFVFLIGWTNVRTINDANALNDAIDSSKKKSSLLSKCLQLFQSHINFLTWLNDVRRYQEGASNLPNTSDLLSMLQTSSPLSLMYRFLNLHTIDPAHILEKLQKVLVDIDDEAERQNGKKSVRFLDTPPSLVETLRSPQTIAAMIYLGFLSVNLIIQQIISPIENVSSIVEKAKFFLDQIFPLCFRLELLENIFSLIFLENMHLKGEEPNETIDPSNNTASNSMSPSEKLFSSSQNQQTTINQDIKTFDSINMNDVEIDENLDEDYSIGSSSMSSTGGSTSASIYRNGFLIDEETLTQLLIFLGEQVTQTGNLYQKIRKKEVDRETVHLETSLEKSFQGYSIGPNEQFASRTSKLKLLINESLWRCQLLTTEKDRTLSNDFPRSEEQENQQTIIVNQTVKQTILSLPRKGRRKISRRLSESSNSSSHSISSSKANDQRAPSVLVSQILSTRDNLLSICLKEGKITEANEVIRQLNMQDHPLAVEANFSKTFRDTSILLSTNYASKNNGYDQNSTASQLANLATMASSALGNASLQKEISPLIEAAQSASVSSTLPSSNYFDQTHFVSLTLFDLAVSAPTMSVTKMLLEMAQNRLPKPVLLFPSVTSSITSINTKTLPSSTVHGQRIKTLNEMILNYIQLTGVPFMNSLQDLLLDVTIPLDGPRANKIVQYYKRIEDHCRQYYINENNGVSMDEQVKLTSDLFETDPNSKLNLLTYIKNSSQTNKVQAENHMNYFSIFYSYLKNFRALLEKFPIVELPAPVDLSKHSPVSLVHRIVARSTDVDLTQLQLMTSKLNIDISLAVCLNIIRPLFVDKTMVSSSLSSTRRATLLQQKSLDLTSTRYLSENQVSPSVSCHTTRRAIRRSTSIYRRLTSRSEHSQSEINLTDEHPEQFVRTLLTRLVDVIRKTIQNSNQTNFRNEHIQILISTEEYEDVLNSLPLLSYLNLDLLTLNEERICFFVNSYNLFSIISQIELIRSSTTPLTSTQIFRNDLERLLFFITTRFDIGQLKQISLFDIRHIVLKQQNQVDPLRFEVDPKSPLLMYAPELKGNVIIKVGLLLNECTLSSSPLIIGTPELVNEQMHNSTREFLERCTKTSISETNIQACVPTTLANLFPDNNENLIKFLGEFSSTNDILAAMNGNIPLNVQKMPSQNDFAIVFDLLPSIKQLEETMHRRRRRTSSLPTMTSITTVSTPTDFLSQTNSLPNHLIDSRTIDFVREKSPALGQILQIYVQSIVKNLSIEADRTALKNYFADLLLPPLLTQLNPSIGDEWFRSVVLNDLTYQHDLLLHLSSLLWDQKRYKEIVELFDSLRPSFIVHSVYCQTLRDLALLSMIKETSAPDAAYHCLRKIRDCHLLIQATIHHLPRFDGPTCLKLLQLCLTLCKKYHQDYVPWVQERLNIMYVYKALCLGALAQFNKIMEKISNIDDKAKISIEDMAIKTTSGKCLTWQRAQEHSQINPLAVVEMFIFENQYDMGHKWLTLLDNQVATNLINRVRFKLVEEHIHWLVKEENFNNCEKVLQVINTITTVDDKWHLCTDLYESLSRRKFVTHTKAIPFSRLFFKFRLVQYMLTNFNEKSEFFKDEYERKTLSILVIGLSIFFNCIPLEQTDSYVHLITEPLAIFEQLLMNSSIDVAKLTIETLKVLVKKYDLEETIDLNRIDELIEVYTRKSVKLNVVQPTDEPSTNDAKSTNLQQASNPQGLSTIKNNGKSKNMLDGSPSVRQDVSTPNSFISRSMRERVSMKIGKPPVLNNDNDIQFGSLTNIPSSPIATRLNTTDTIPIGNYDRMDSSSYNDKYPPSVSRLDTTPMSMASSPQIDSRKGGNDFNVPPTAPSKKLWVSDSEVMKCMCCNTSRFSMFNRRHHCRRCGRVVCHDCSQKMTMIKGRLERTCNDCYRYLQNNPPNVTPTRPEPTVPTRTRDAIRLSLKPVSSSKRLSIADLYINNHRTGESAPNFMGAASSLGADTYTILEEPLPISASVMNTNYMEQARANNRMFIESPQQNDNETPVMPIVNDQVHYQLTGTLSDNQIRNDFHYDQSPSISLCLSLIELHSDQYKCGKILMNLCEYLSEQLSSKERNIEIDYGLVLSIIKSLLFTAKMKIMTATVDEEQLSEQQKLLASCDMYNNLIDILNRLNMANCSLPALNELLQQDTLRKIRNQLLDDERYQLAMDISTRCNLDTPTVWFRWGMAYLQVGQYGEARDKFDKCLQKTIESTDSHVKSNQTQRTSIVQEKMVNEIVTYLESTVPLKFAVRYQYISGRQNRQSFQTHVSMKYLSGLSAVPRVTENTQKIIEGEILYYLQNYSDDVHMIEYYIRHRLYEKAFEYKCTLNVFRDQIYMPLLKRNHLHYIFNYVTSNPSHSLNHHLKYMCNCLKEMNLLYSLRQLQIFLGDFMSAGSTSVLLFTQNPTSYIDFYEKRLIHLEKAIELFQQAKVDSEQTMGKIRTAKTRVELQIEITRYIYDRLKTGENLETNSLADCPTLFESKDTTIKLIIALITISDDMQKFCRFVFKIKHETKLTDQEVFLPCALQLGRRRDYQSLQEFLRVLSEQGLNDSRLADEIIERCIIESGSDVEQSREQDALIQAIKNEDIRVNAYIGIGKLRNAYLTAIRSRKEEKIRLIRDEAQKMGQMAVYDMCNKWLENRGGENS